MPMTSKCIIKQAKLDAETLDVHLDSIGSTSDGEFNLPLRNRRLCFFSRPVEFPEGKGLYFNTK